MNLTALSAMAAQFNTYSAPQREEQTKRRFGGKCLYIPEDLYKNKDMTFNTVILGGQLFSVCRKQTKKQLAEKLKRSVSTVYRSFKTLENKNMIKRTSGDFFTIDRSKINGNGLHLRIPVCYTIHEFKDKYGKTSRLTPAELLITGIILTRCDNAKRNRNEYAASMRQIKRELGGNISLKTIHDAIESLIAKDIIFRTEKGVNLYRTATYHFNFTLLTRVDKALKRNSTKPPEPIGNSPTWAERERYYERLQKIAKEKAEQARAKAELDDTYFHLHNDLISLILSDADDNPPPTRKWIKEQTAETEKLLDQRLAQIGIDKATFEPEFYCRCKLCNDTGQRIDNHMPCDCYKRRL